jgi:phosphatidylserine/phosphatidylglycerophosphate/cardiolipin synthase-like enzyme
MKTVASKNGFTVVAYKGDASTMLAFDLDENNTDDLAGFSIRYTTPSGKSFFLGNRLSFDVKITNATSPDKRSYTSSELAPFQKFRWLHVPGDFHQALNKTEYGEYSYHVTPRYFKNGKLLPLDTTLTVNVKIDVSPFALNNSFVARGFMASQAYVHRFGKTRNIRPNDKDLLFDIKKKSGTSPAGNDFTFEDQYRWMGFTAREKLLDYIDEAIADKDISLDVFAYDLNEPSVCDRFLTLAREGRVRIILDNASLHVHSENKNRPDSYEDMFEDEFNQVKKGKAAIVRAHFGRYAHNKVIIQKEKGTPVSVLTGSTNFSTNGVYINANHIIILRSEEAALLYQKIFDQSFTEEGRKDIRKYFLTAQSNKINDPSLPEIYVAFSPHSEDTAKDILHKLCDKIQHTRSSVLFAVMELGGTGEVLDELKQLHRDSSVFSYGVTDTTSGIKLYKPDDPGGILVTGKKIQSKLPPPFDQEVSPAGHEIHHKFIVLDFNGTDPVVFCGSSNLAEGGEKANADNLIEIRDEGIATAFAIEAIRLVDHYHFRDAMLNADNTKPLLLATTDKWCRKYYDHDDLHFRDRKLFTVNSSMGTAPTKTGRSEGKKVIGKKGTRLKV